ncbi:hypothetical protein [Dyella tabacisoli]|uniref:Uncharacterized protein n=1 Tax=Dyella tabacisoli TaxID=2282381 RepID=A0A369UKQ4_9GAMM|nr:hypothetical protein [Dyella tabacisoli]RDD81352.1 hypothetical protein DVJ77_13785 [Dyella tabacisoli]
MTLHELPINNEHSPSRIEQRIAVLRQEYEAGQAQLRALEQRTRDLQNTMLRISGAITVLEELLSEEQAP